MRIALVVGTLFSICAGQSQPPAFAVASVKPSQRVVGKDTETQVTFGPAGLSGRNLTLKRLITTAYQVQPHQVAGGPNWLDSSEYDIDAKADGPATKEQLALMLRTLLADRFRLSLHNESKELHVYDLVVDKSGPKIHPVQDGDSAGARSSRGTLQQFANRLSIQLTIPALSDPGKPGIASGPPVPVLDKTGLPGIYDIRVDLKPELGVDMFTLWQRALQDQLGLKLESRREKMEVLVVDHAEKIPTTN